MNVKQMIKEESFPMSLKKQLSDKLKNGFVIKRAVFNQCLELYPLKEWDSLMERINKLNRFNKKILISFEDLQLVLDRLI